MSYKHGHSGYVRTLDNISLWVLYVDCTRVATACNVLLILMTTITNSTTTSTTPTGSTTILQITSCSTTLAVFLYVCTSVSSNLCFALRGVFLQQLQAEARDLLLDAHHNVGVVLISLKLVGEARHAVPNKFIVSRQVRLDGLQDNIIIIRVITIHLKTYVGMQSHTNHLPVRCLLPTL